MDVAASEYGKGGRPTNTSRIALLTGLDRKDVKRLRDAASSSAPPEPERSRSGPLGRVLSGWHQDPDFSDDIAPRSLNIEEEFADLCKRYGGDVTRTAILAELLRVGAVVKQDHEKIVAVKRFYMPDQTDTEALTRSLDVYRDLGNTLVYNLYRDATQPSRFEGRATNPSVPVRHAHEFRQFVEHHAQRFLEVVDAQLCEFEEDQEPAGERIRLGIGLYCIEGQEVLTK